jgi:N-methylhydantoinase B
MQSAVAIAFAFVLDPDIPKNAGTFRPLTVIAKPGTIVWAQDNAPVTMCTSHPSNEIIEAIIKALAPICPERVMGGWGRRFRLAIKGRDERRGKPFIWHMFHARPGGGASIAGEGWSSVGEWHSAGGLKFGSVEVDEARFPLLFHKHEFREGSGGEGRFRGGMGVDLELAVETEHGALINTAGDGIRHGAAGLLGGEDGLPHAYQIRRADGSTRVLKTKEVGVTIEPGDLIEVHSGGGGGWGEPDTPRGRIKGEGSR